MSGSTVSCNSPRENCAVLRFLVWTPDCPYGRMRSALSQGLDTNRFFGKTGENNDEKTDARARRRGVCGRLRYRGGGEACAGTRAETCAGTCARTGARARAKGGAGSCEAEAGRRESHLPRRRAVRVRQVADQARGQV